MSQALRNLFSWGNWRTQFLLCKDGGLVPPNEYKLSEKHFY